MPKGLKKFIHRTIWSALPRPWRRFVLFGFMNVVAPRAQQKDISGDHPVYVAGFFRSATGLGHSARLSLKSLAAQGRPVTGIDIGGALMQSDDIPPPEGVVPSARMLPAGPGLVIVHTSGPLASWANFTLGRRFLKDKRVVGYWAWELPDIPADWIAAFRFVDEIWAPSEFVKGALRRHTDKQIKVVPYVVSGIAPSSRLFAEDGVVRVLTVFNMSSGYTRKNPLGAINAFREAFGNDARFSLTVKFINGAANPRGYSELRTAACNAPNIHLREGIDTASELYTLFDQSDIFISMHRSEGYGLPLREAMLKGLYVVATGWSGNTDFMTGERCYLVPYKMVTAKDPQGTYEFGGMQWADPDISAASRILRRIVDLSMA